MADFHYTPIKLGYFAHDHSGRKIGRLTAIAPVSRHSRNIYWLCRCDCGTEKTISAHSFVHGKTMACGCLRLERVKEANSTHGASLTPTHKIWLGINRRCRNVNDRSYPKYGGRGITICERWNDFSNFLADMGERPGPKYSIDRIDNNGPYSPENCRWATNTQQVRNRRNTLMQEYNGTVKPLAKWADELGIKYQTLFQRIHVLGWPIDRAMTEKVRGH